MSTDTTRMMQEALQAAVTRINSNGPAEPGPSPGPGAADTMGALMSMLPKLLQNTDSRDTMLEKLDTLQKGDLAALREQLQTLRKYCHRTLRSQEQLLKRIDAIQTQQRAVGAAVLDLAEQMARIRFVDDAPDARGGIDYAPPDDDGYEWEAPPPPAARRGDFRTGRDGRGRSQRET